MKQITKQNIARWGSIGSLCVLAAVFTQCVPSSPKSSSSNSSYVEVSSPGGLEQAEAEAPTVGVKDADRILYTMAAVTGVEPASNATIRNTYTDLKAQLPANSRLESLSENQMVTVTKLAAEFCQQLVGNATLRASVWPSTNLAVAWKTAGSLNNDTQRGNFVVGTLEKFWGADVQQDMVYQESYDVLVGLLSELLDGPPEAANNATSTQNAAKAVCTAALSSAPVWMN